MTLYADRLNAAYAWRPALSRAPSVVSLFAGCGGSSLGYRMAGFAERAAVEWDESAALTFRTNFPGVPIHVGDINELSDQQALDLAQVQPGDLDVLDGSPPCQGFSTSGVRVARNMHDPRNRLFEQHVRLLAAFRPHAFVMENVTGLVKGPMRLIFAEIWKALTGCGYRLAARVVDARWYGTATRRQRVIFIGLRNDVGDGTSEPLHPRPWCTATTAQDALAGLDDPEAKRLRDWTQAAVGRGSKIWTDWQLIPPGFNQATTRNTLTGFNVNKYDPRRPAPTITRSDGMYLAAGAMHWNEPRRFTVREFARMQSFPDAFTFPQDVSNRVGYQQAVGQVGNSVPPMLMRSIALGLLPQIGLEPVISHDPLDGAALVTAAASSVVTEST